MRGLCVRGAAGRPAPLYRRVSAGDAAVEGAPASSPTNGLGRRPRLAAGIPAPNEAAGDSAA